MPMIRGLRLFCLLAISFLACTGASSPALAVTMETIQVAGIEVDAWMPRVAGKTPPIIFSHGFNGCGASQQFLTNALANAGYAVFAPVHQDSRCNQANQGAITGQPKISFFSPEAWSDQSYVDRRDDIKKIIDALEADPRYQSLDWDHLGMAGHSLGGYTALAMAGAWPSWKDKRIKAVLALSPYAKPFLTQHTLALVDVPVMYQCGTADWLGKDTSMKNGAYDQTTAPKSLVEFGNANHVVWTDNGIDYYKFDISDYSVAFFDYYLKNKPIPNELTQKDVWVSDLRLDAMAPKK